MQGTIVGSVRGRSDTNSHAASYPEVRYVAADGATRTFVNRYGFGGPPLHRAVTVLINPADPDDVVHAGSYGGQTMGCILLAVGLLLTFIGLWVTAVGWAS